MLRRIEGTERLSRAVRGGGPLVDEKMLAALGRTVRAPALYGAFAEAAFDDEIWNAAVKAPARYLRSKGVRLPKGVRVVLTEHRHRHPWPDRETELQLVVRSLLLAVGCRRSRRRASAADALLHRGPGVPARLHPRAQEVAGAPRSRSIATTPSAGPGARNANAQRQPTVVREARG